MIRIEIEFEQHEDKSSQIKMAVIEGVDTVELERMVAIMLRKHFVEFSESVGMQTEITEG